MGTGSFLPVIFIAGQHAARADEAAPVSGEALRLAEGAGGGKR